jgi:hypothetical protein
VMDGVVDEVLDESDIVADFATLYMLDVRPLWVGVRIVLSLRCFG